MRGPELLTPAFLARACSEGILINRGPLNDAYRVTIHGLPMFVRHRVLHDALYGQTFAAEEYLPPVVRSLARVPTLYRVLADDSGRRSWAVFDFVSGGQPDWNSDGALIELAATLGRVHTVAGTAFGDILGPFRTQPAPAYLSGLLEAELDRLTGPSPLVCHLQGMRSHTRELMDVFADERPCLCHGDIHADNFLADPQQRMWLLDWEAARFRVAAADFNQLHAKCLSPGQCEDVLTAYCALTGRDPATFRIQVDLLRLLWHVRTYNFEVLVRRTDPAGQEIHLRRAATLQAALRQRRRPTSGPRERQA
ncbi:phosphotransferase [Embleya sp. NPDC001921]